jgi:hypothetical protein
VLLLLLVQVGSRGARKERNVCVVSLAKRAWGEDRIYRVGLERYEAHGLRFSITFFLFIYKSLLLVVFGTYINYRNLISFWR